MHSFDLRKLRLEFFITQRKEISEEDIVVMIRGGDT